MSYIDQTRDYGYLAPTGVKTEKAFWLLAVVISVIPPIGALFFVDVGSLYSGADSIYTVAVGFTIVMTLVAAVQIAGSLWMRSSFRESVVYLPTVRTAKRLMTPVGLPILVGLFVFELILGLSYGVDAVLFIIGTFIVSAISGMFGTMFWYRIRKAERTLPRSPQPPAANPGYTRGL